MRVRSLAILQHGEYILPAALRSIVLFHDFFLFPYELLAICCCFVMLKTPHSLDHMMGKFITHFQKISELLHYWLKSAIDAKTATCNI